MSISVVVAGSEDIPGAKDACAEAFAEHNGADPRVSLVNDPTGAELIVFFEENSFKLRGSSKMFEVNPFVMDHLEKLYTVNYDAVARRHIPGLYTALKKSWTQDSLFQPSVYPKTINAVIDSASDEDRAKSPQWLFSFRGARDKAPVRSRIFACYEGRHEQWLVGDSATQNR
ncbi:MAG: hypothetical protein O2901_04745 [Verrucomicrobia bacterium]|nr:hypothetical protein [Verrucomicrobiota bacterium]